ncbi:hypothetical protein OH76DRAFT_1480779 [Lentinus brumalis]|uniref:BTB domain-containing protein n=1 Tax=Lentinus brumalis TaxID=2498619 RepID=A0A371DHX9_9APHY|nr:hypothetical protein OH76DRAFT_1480779 [Polyporus brumalis]
MSPQQSQEGMDGVQRSARQGARGVRETRGLENKDDSSEGLRSPPGTFAIKVGGGSSRKTDVATTHAPPLADRIEKRVCADGSIVTIAVESHRGGLKQRAEGSSGDLTESAPKRTKLIDRMGGTKQRAAHPSGSPAGAASLGRSISRRGAPSPSASTPLADVPASPSLRPIATSSHSTATPSRPVPSYSRPPRRNAAVLAAEHISRRAQAAVATSLSQAAAPLDPEPPVPTTESAPVPHPKPKRPAPAQSSAIDTEVVKETPVIAAELASSQQVRTASAPMPPAPIESRKIKTESVSLDRPAPVEQRLSAKPALAQPIFPAPDVRSVEFWYVDGNIVVNVEGTYFKLLLSRLERHCGYFERVSNNRAWTVVSGQKVVEVRDLKLQDFETFLKYLEIPMEHSIKDASKETAMSLLRASRVLSCKVIGDLAEARILGPWSSVSVPMPGDGLGGRPYREAIEMLGVVQGLKAPLVRKQVLYALLANDHFWSDVASRRADVDISDADLLMLYRTRAAMQEKWRVHVLAPPKACHTTQCLPNEGARSALWAGQMAQYATTEVRDPLRKIEGVRTAVRKLTNWCRGCVDDRARVMEDARDLWWKELDQLFGIAGPHNVPLGTAI